jgi:predicted PurR-regulated permease PerM
MSAGRAAEVVVDAKTAQERRVAPDADKAVAAEAADATEKRIISWRAAAQAAIIGIFLIMFWGVLEFARPILLPLVSALVVSLMLGPLSARATAFGIPQSITATVLLALVIGIFYGIIVLLSAPVVEWIGKAPEVGGLIRQKLYVLDRPLAALEDLRKALSPQGSGLKVDTGTDLVSPVLTVVTPAVGQVVVFIGSLFFFLLGRNELRRYLVVFFDKRESRLRTLRILNDVEHHLTSYLSIVAVINACVGVFAGVATYLVGYPNPVALAVLAFVLNFIPYVGPLLMEIVLFGVGLITFPTFQEALIAPLLFLAFTTLEGHFITPMIMGARLTLAPITVFIALVFWTWLWGPVGAFLAVPLLIVGVVTMQHLYPEDQALPG